MNTPPDPAHEPAHGTGEPGRSGGRRQRGSPRPRRVPAAAGAGHTTPGHTRPPVDPEAHARAAGQPDPGSYTRGELREWLLSGAPDYSKEQYAAVLMLCDHRSWLDRADFRVLACDVRPAAGWARVSPGEALAACDDGRMHPYGDSAYTILQIAAMLSGTAGPLARPVQIGRLDRENVALVVGAFAAACGFELTGTGLLRMMAPETGPL